MTNQNHTEDEIEKPLRKRERTRLRIIEAATALFRRKGYNETNVSEICDEAGIARATFFTHFSSKVDLIAMVDQNSAANWVRQCEGKHFETPLQELEAFIVYLFARTKDADMVRALSVGFFMSFGRDMSASEGNHSLHGAAFDIISRAQADGLIGLEWSAKLLARYILGAYVSLLDLLEDHSAEDAAQKTMQLCLDGVRIRSAGG